MDTKKRRKREGLTIENVLDKSKYRNIFALMMMAYSKNNKEKIRFIHFRYALVDNHKLKFQDIKKITKAFPFFKKENDKESKEKDLMKKLGFFKDGDKFTTNQALSNSLARINIKGLDLINSIPEKKKKPYYIFTDKGWDAYLRWYIKNLVYLSDTEELKNLLDLIEKNSKIIKNIENL